MRDGPASPLVLEVLLRHIVLIGGGSQQHSGRELGARPWGSHRRCPGSKVDPPKDPRGHVEVVGGEMRGASPHVPNGVGLGVHDMDLPLRGMDIVSRELHGQEVVDRALPVRLNVIGERLDGLGVGRPGGEGNDVQQALIMGVFFDHVGGCVRPRLKKFRIPPKHFTFHKKVLDKKISDKKISDKKISDSATIGGHESRMVTSRAEDEADKHRPELDPKGAA